MNGSRVSRVAASSNTEVLPKRYGRCVALLEPVDATLLENRTVGESQPSQRCPREAFGIHAAPIEIYSEGRVAGNLRFDRISARARCMTVHDDRAIVTAMRPVVENVSSSRQL